MFLFRCQSDVQIATTLGRHLNLSPPLLEFFWSTADSRPFLFGLHVNYLPSAEEGFCG